MPSSRSRSSSRRRTRSRGRGGSRGRESDRKVSKSVLVKNLHFDATTDGVREAFSRFGVIKDVHIPMNYYTRKPKGFCFVEFEDGRDAEEAVAELDNSRLMDNVVTCCIAKDQRKSPRTMRRIEEGRIGSGFGGRSRSRSRGRRRDSRSRGRRRDSRSRSRRR